MSFGMKYRQCSNGNYEPIEEFAAVTCQQCGDELNPYDWVFERNQRFMCAGCYLESMFRKEVIGDWYTGDQEAARKVADLFDDTYMEAEDLLNDYSASDLNDFF